MIMYNVHYRDDFIVPGSGTIESLLANEGLKTVERHGRATATLEWEIEYASDIVEVERMILESINVNFDCSNVRVLSWQPLIGEQRPSSTS